MPIAFSDPDATPVFADRASPRLTRRWRKFTPYDIYCGASDLRVLIVTERHPTKDVGDAFHICIVQEATDNAVSITHVFERIATILYLEACLDAEKSAAENAAKKTKGARKTPFRDWIDQIRDFFQRRRSAPVLDPGLFHFYQYFPQNGAYAGSPESFSRVSLCFDADQHEFRKRDWSDWRSLRDIPDAIRSAFTDAGRIITVTQRGREPIEHPIVGAWRDGEKPAA